MGSLVQFLKINALAELGIELKFFQINAEHSGIKKEMNKKRIVLSTFESTVSRLIYTGLTVF